MSTSTPEAAGLSDRMRLAVLDNLSDGVYFVDRDRRITYWNKGAERLTGFSAPEVVGRRCRDGILTHCDAAGTQLCGSRCPLLATIHDGRVREAHIFLHHKQGHRRPVSVRAAPLRDEAGAIVGAVEIFNDDSALLDTRRRADGLERRAMTDPLTGIGNRRLAEMTLAGWLEQHRGFDWSFGVLFADVDEFKVVNDTYGHGVGDEALRIVARTLAHGVRQGDTVARWGGEEFVVLTGGADGEALTAVAERLRALVEQSKLFVDRRRVPLTISVGATLVAPGDSADGLIHRADALLYDAKLAGRNRVALDA
jgi:diguanylate cyclase (GGDEF)-like protein/PAS domain S-box-containing protein